MNPVAPSLHEVPAHVQAMIDAYPRTPAGSTSALVEALRPLAAAGLTDDEIASVGFGRFPVGGEATWIHDWLFPRYVPTFHTHEGIDIFADRGTPVRAPAAGAVGVSNGSVGGLAVKVVEPDGTYWYMSHLDAVVAGVDGTTVEAATVLGTVGDSGNARGGSPHVHLQLHPQGGEPVDPKPVIDQLAAEALANVPAVLAAHEGPSVVFQPFTWEPAPKPVPREPERDPILDLLLPLARLEDDPGEEPQPE